MMNLAGEEPSPSKVYRKGLINSYENSSKAKLDQ